MAKIIATRGMPGAGKTTWALEYLKDNPNTIRANRDHIRMMLFNTKKDFSYDKEEKVSKVQRAIVDKALSDGLDVVIDDTHLRPKYLTEWSKIAYKHGAEVEVKEFHLPLERVIGRNQSRPEEDRVPEDVLRTMWNKFMPKGSFIPWSAPKEEVEEVEQIVPNPDLTDAVICDLDGTLSLLGDRGPYDYSRVSEDTVNEAVRYILDLIGKTGTRIIFMSGREQVDGCYDDTKAWIEKHLGYLFNGHGIVLHMREKGDMRKDSVVKKELFDKYVRDKYNVLLALDDRDQVVKLWRDMGIPTFQVNYGDF